ncbi:hypothetical protein DAI22_10g043300 [Oryza sativa Japonica Group]|nr:hypothetical protein DAI22_10g043300 [Oryza sativa Japonica Group]
MPPLLHLPPSTRATRQRQVRRGHASSRRLSRAPSRRCPAARPASVAPSRRRPVPTRRPCRVGRPPPRASSRPVAASLASSRPAAVDAPPPPSASSSARLDAPPLSPVSSSPSTHSPVDSPALSTLSTAAVSSHQRGGQDGRRGRWGGPRHHRRRQGGTNGTAVDAGELFRRKEKGRRNRGEEGGVYGEGGRIRSPRAIDRPLGPPDSPPLRLGRRRRRLFVENEVAMAAHNAAHGPPRRRRTPALAVSPSQ